MSTLGVCYLVREAHGLQTFANFLESYAAHPADVEHDLILIFKGFAGERVPPEYLALLNSVEYKPLFLPDRGFDLGAYFAASAQLQHDYLCFLNSYSVILDDGWLAKMFRHVEEPQVGVVGASASYQSIYTYYLDLVVNLRPGVKPSRYFWRRIVGRFLRGRQLNYFKRVYPPYPNYHLRTNAFMISRKLMLSLKRDPFRKKTDAAEFESGRESFTNQIYARGLKILVVGRDGNAYEKEQWELSRTFRSGNQDNLLVSDNRTQEYALADETEERELRESAWGNERYDRLLQKTTTSVGRRP